MKKRTLLFSLLLLMAVFLLIGAKPLLTQEDHTVSVLSGALRLAFSDEDFLQYDEDAQQLYYISETGADEALLSSLPVLKGYAFTEQMGSGYIFTEENNQEHKVVVSATQFSRFFRIWKIPRR
ncbi:hypothetical protein ACHAL6_09100 [Proteiniclasticum sp. C24MP]|uniref:hypothetical protein n=1 Tax=Proteiniclasticum sp. C24MP TaxID=3374101 RepID=UPI003754F3A8